MNILFTFLILLTLLVIPLSGNKADKEGKSFFSKDYTRALKGACCIIVVFVHVPVEHGNVLQDAVGSFGYVAVTLFFMFSAYGMYLSKQRKPDYMKHFWRNRLSSLLVPMFLINLAGYLYSIPFRGGSLSSLIWINSWVWILLQFCILFYIVELGEHYHLWNEKISKFLLVIAVFVSSLYLYLTSVKGQNSNLSGWCFERLGLIWGLLLLWYFPTIKLLIKPKFWKIVISGIICLVLGVSYLKFKEVFFWGAYLNKIILGIAIIYLLFMVSCRRKWGNKVSFFLGDISYEVYLSHGFVMSVVAHHLPSLPSGQFIVTSIVGTIIFSWFIHLIDRPIIKALRSR